MLDSHGCQSVNAEFLPTREGRVDDDARDASGIWHDVLNRAQSICWIVIPIIAECEHHGGHLS